MGEIVTSFGGEIPCVGPQCGMLTTRCGPTVPALQWPLVGSTGVAIDLAVSELKSTDPSVAGAKVGGVQPGVSRGTSSSGPLVVVVQLAWGR